MMTIYYKSIIPLEMAMIGAFCGICNSWFRYLYLDSTDSIISFNSIAPGLLLGFALFLYLQYKKINERFYLPYNLFFILLTLISYFFAHNFFLQTIWYSFDHKMGIDHIFVPLIYIITGFIGGPLFSYGFKLIEPKISWIKGIIIPTILGAVISFICLSTMDHFTFTLWIAWQTIMCGYFGFLIDRIIKKRTIIVT